MMLRIVMLASKAPSAPQSVGTSLESATSLTVFWMEPKTPNGVLRGYQIIYTVHSDSQQVSCA